MALVDDLKSEVATILREQWTMRDGEAVPDTDDVKLSNDGVKLSATVLYADLAESTSMVDTKESAFSAVINKSLLSGACKIITDHSGVVTAFDGDRVMGVFIGRSKNSSAAKAAMRIKYAVNEIINPAIKVQYPSSDFSVRYGAGIDSSDLLVARTGIRGSNDLVWVGPAANYAAKLATLRKDTKTT